LIGQQKLVLKTKNDQTETNPNVECDDGVDNSDADTLADFNDPGCTGPTDTSELGTVECDDGSDNDGDSYVNTNDAGCLSASDDDETNCGDNVAEGGETCDGADLVNQTCVTRGFDGGLLGCNSGCDGFDTSTCWINTCSDTDSGFNVNVFGTVSGEFEGSPYATGDSCVGNATTLTENYCSSGLAFDAFFECNTGNSTTTCLNGACV
jgi:hypothetical protein